VTARVGALLWIIAAVAYFVIEAVAAAALTDYRYLTDYVSTLGIPGVSPDAQLMNCAFLTQGVAFPLGALLVVRGTRARKSLPFLALTMVNGVGNLVVAAVHSGAGSVLHVLAAGFAITSGNAAVLVGSAMFRRPGVHFVSSMALGVLGLSCAVALAAGATPVGLWERGSVYPIFIWQACTACCLLYRLRAR
jgi:hypothetical membrane protein